MTGRRGVSPSPRPRSSARQRPPGRTPTASLVRPAAATRPSDTAPPEGCPARSPPEVGPARGAGESVDEPPAPGRAARRPRVRSARRGCWAQPVDFAVLGDEVRILVEPSTPPDLARRNAALRDAGTGYLGGKNPTSSFRPGTCRCPIFRRNRPDSTCSPGTRSSGTTAAVRAAPGHGRRRCRPSRCRSLNFPDWGWSSPGFAEVSSKGHRLQLYAEFSLGSPSSTTKLCAVLASAPGLVTCSRVR